MADTDIINTGIIDSGIIVDRGIIYAEKPGYRALELDVHRPAAPSGRRPLLVNIHGGGWRVSNRQRAPRETRGWDRSFHARMVDAGFVVVAPSYRLSAEALYPAAIDDVADALVFARDQADAWGADPGRVVLFGQSAGGYLALALGLAEVERPVQGVVAWYPVTDFSAFDDDESAAIFPSHWLGAPLSAVATLVEQSNLTRQVRADAPPVLLQHGTADTMAPYDQSVRLHGALTGVGAEVTFETVEGAGHFFGGADDDEVVAIFDRAMAFALRCTGG